MPTKAVKITLQATIAICDNVYALNNWDSSLRKFLQVCWNLSKVGRGAKGKSTLPVEFALRVVLDFLCPVLIQ